MTGLHVTGVDAVTGEHLDLWCDGGEFVDGPVPDAIELSGWLLPGFVDAHCHVGYAADGATDLQGAREQAKTALTAGVLAIRDCGSPVDTRPLVGQSDLPVLIRAGRHIARARRYIRDLGVEVEPDQLPAEVARQAAYGGGWVKIVGDWIDRSIGDLAPLWPDDVLAEAIAVAHAAGARVTSHVFGGDALPGLLAAGIDCIEHGTGLDDETIATMARQHVRLVPTMINIANFPSFADAAERYPTYAAHIRDLYTRSDRTVRDAVEAGVQVYAGTDAGGFVAHGRVVDEVMALSGVMDRREAFAAATHRARRWLSLGVYEIGTSADLVVYGQDPGADPADLPSLRHPVAVIRAGVPRSGAAVAGRMY